MIRSNERVKLLKEFKQRSLKNKAMEADAEMIEAKAFENQLKGILIIETFVN
jgi:hypothetical protein